MSYERRRASWIGRLLEGFLSGFFSLFPHFPGKRIEETVGYSLDGKVPLYGLGFVLAFWVFFRIPFPLLIQEYPYAVEVFLLSGIVSTLLTSLVAFFRARGRQGVLNSVLAFLFGALFFAFFHFFPYSRLSVYSDQMSFLALISALLALSGVLEGFFGLSVSSVLVASASFLPLVEQTSSLLRLEGLKNKQNLLFLGFLFFALFLGLILGLLLSEQRKKDSRAKEAFFVGFFLLALVFQMPKVLHPDILYTDVTEEDYLWIQTMVITLSGLLPLLLSLVFAAPYLRKEDPEHPLGVNRTFSPSDIRKEDLRKGLRKELSR